MMRKKFKRGDTIESNKEREGEDSGRAREREGLNFTLKENFLIHRPDQRNCKQKPNHKGEIARGTRRSRKLQKTSFSLSLSF